MKKPKYINRPEDVTVHDGKPRKNHRSLTKEEIEFLKSDMYIRWANQKDFGSISWNFERKFGWKPLLNTLKCFYDRKTYKWAWELDINNIPKYKKQTKEYQGGVYDEYKDDIILALKDPYFGANNKNFAEFINVFCPKIKYVKNIIAYLRKKYNVQSIQKEKTQKIISTILTNRELETCELYELIKKEFDLDFNAFNYYCKKANLKNHLTDREYKRLCKKRKEDSLHITSVEVRYNINGKFYVEQIELSNKVLSKIKNDLLKKF